MAPLLESDGPSVSIELPRPINTLGGLREGITYKFRVRSKHERSVWSAWKEKAPPTEWKSAIGATALSPSMLHVAWEGGAVDSYLLFLAEGSEANITRVLGSSGPSTMVGSVSGLMQHRVFLRVASFANNQCVGVSRWVMFEASFDNLLPDMPEPPLVSSYNATAVQVEWERPVSRLPHSLTAIIEVRAEEQPEYVVLYRGGSRSTMAAGLQPGVRYFFRVSFESAKGSSEPSDPFSYTIRQAADRIPRVEVRDLATTAVRVSWYGALLKTSSPITLLVNHTADGQIRTVHLPYEPRHFDLTGLAPDSHYVLSFQIGDTVGDPHTMKTSSTPQAFVQPARPKGTQASFGCVALGWAFPTPMGTNFGTVMSITRDSMEGTAAERPVMVWVDGDDVIVLGLVEDADYSVAVQHHSYEAPPALIRSPGLES